MQKSESIMNITLGAVLSLALSFLGSIRGGNFSVAGWLLTCLVSFIISQLIGLLIPYKWLIEDVCQKIKVKKESFKGIIVSALIIDLTYTPVLSGSMCYVMTFITLKLVPFLEGPPLIVKMISSVSLSFIVAFIIITLMLPLIYKLLRNVTKNENEEALANKNRLVYVTAVLLIISFIVYSVLSVISIDKMLNSENRSMAELLATDIYNKTNDELKEKIEVGRIIANDAYLVELLSDESKYSSDELEMLIKERLLSYANKYECDTAFLVSNATGNYYTESGFNKTMMSDLEDHDEWYLSFVNMNKEYDIDIDTDEAHGKNWTVFVNVRIEDENGELLGVCGIGTKVTDLQEFISNLESTYDAKVGAVDENNAILLNIEGINIDQIIHIQEKRLQPKDGLQYLETGTGYVVIIPMEALGWKLIIKRDVDLLGVLIGNISKNLLVLSIIFAIFIVIATLLLGKSSSILARNLQFESYETLKNIYEGIYVFDIDSGLVSEIKNLLPDNTHLFNSTDPFDAQMREVIDKWIFAEHRKELYDFFTHKEDELAGADSSSSRTVQFIINDIGWCRGNLVVVKDAKNKKDDHKLFLIEVIEEEVRRQSKMRQETEEAKSANEAKGRFLANMSHEIRTPINAVLGLDTMILRESTEPAIKEYAANIQNAGNTLLSLINDILDFSKIESGKMDIVPVEYDLSSLINDVMNMISIKAKAKNLDFKVVVDEKLPARLYGDDIRIRQVLLNIMNNAVKYTNNGGITFTVSGVTTDDYIDIHFSVKDTGIGIKEEDMGKLFADFERIEESRNRSIEGTGLGMSITVQLLKLMDSKLQVESVYGEGSEFYFDLKQIIKNSEPIGNFSNRIMMGAKEYEYNAPYTAPDAKILVVDDTEINRVVLAGLLKETLIVIDEAGSGAEGLNKILNNDYDIIFLDHMMPDMDGPDVVKEFKKLVGEGKVKTNLNTPIIALTANAISGAREQYIEMGFSDYLSKPIIPDKLENMVRKLVPDDKMLRA